MALDPSGPISIDDIVGEFGHTAPDDQMNEYYRDGILVTDNNLNVPLSGNPIDIDDFYSAERKHIHTITTTSLNIDLSSFFTEEQWAENVPKEVVIDTGVIVASTSVGSYACVSGTTVGVSALGGTLKLIINGYIYGAGGAASSGTGGPCVNAQIPMIIENNGRIWSGGGGGGNGGTGAGGWHYPEDKTWKYQWDFTSYASYWVSFSGLNNLHYGTIQPPVSIEMGAGTFTQYNYGGFTYYKGAFVETFFASSYFRIRRMHQTVQTGGAGGSGGRGQGYLQSLVAGSAGASAATADGGNGGSGSGWGVTGVTGDSGDDVNTAYTTKTINQTGGAGGGLAGFYIVGNTNVTWDVSGDRLGRVSA